jgi:hypothetical protein
LNDRILGRSNKRFDRSGISMPLIENLSLAQILPARSIAALDTLRINKTTQA